jgi:hypothetical protein
VTRRQRPIVGIAVPAQTTLRPEPPVRDLDEFLAFLADFEALFGPFDQSRPPTTGDHFRL